MTMMKKISAMAMATAMAATMAVGTAMSASAEELDTPAYEEIEAAAISTTGKAVVWNPSSNGTSNLSYFVGKFSNPRNESMAADAIKNATLNKNGTTYTLTLTTQTISHDLGLTTYHANVKTVTAVFQDGTKVDAVKNGNVFTITFNSSEMLPWVGTYYANGYENSIELDFTTTLEDQGGAWSFLPDSMKNPQTYFKFTT